nr:hypothetical protein [Flavisolibacter sp.]
YKNITVDEQGKQVIEFKDKEGKVILKKVQIGTVTDAGTGSGHANWLCTYYIYDDLNNLRCVIQPRGVELLHTANWSSATFTSILPEQCFRYEYDHRNRMVMKKVPGAGEVYMVYDKKDRLIMTQDKNMRTPGNINYQKWLVMKYDDLNRPFETGLWLSTLDFATQRSNALMLTTPLVTSSNYEILTKTGYDTYTTIPSESGLSNTIDNSHAGHTLTSNTSPDYAEAIPSTASTLIRDLVTWTQTRVLGTSTFLYSVNIYDDKGRLMQVKATNLNGSDVMTTQYNWSGQPLISLHKQIITGTGAQTTVTVSRMHYDDLGRLAKTEKKLQHTSVNGNAMSAYKILAENKYDALGQLKNKKLAPAHNSNAGLETLAYDYNIRGWMLGMNRDYLSSTGQSGALKFGFELGYDKITNKSNQVFAGSGLFNGNITGIVWKSDGDDVRRIYDFTYDNANRLLKGDFKQDNGSTTWNKTIMDYSIKMGDGAIATTAYDANGNIKKMTQFGWRLGVSNTTPIDNLTYNYIANSNKLLNVKDANNVADTKLGDFRTSTLHPVQSKTVSTVDYSYDENGNMVKDLNKDIITSAGANGIVYNHLNLPQTITVKKDASSNKGTITYTYDAAGNKLKKETNEPASSANNNTSTVTTTLYIGGFVYESKVVNGATVYANKLQFGGHEEGRIRALYLNISSPHAITGFAYDYLLKDHLGNVRMVLTEEAQSNAYVAATLEPATIISEEIYYDNLSNTQYAKPSWFSDPLYSTSTKVAQVKNATTTQKVGPNILLKVMAGDTYNIRVASGWSSGSSAT